MITSIETLPNEILLHVFSYLEWFDLLTSLWSLNIRFNSLICSINRGLITQNLSYNKCSRLFSSILDSSSLSSSIHHIHFDGANSNAYEFYFEWLFNDRNILCFRNLKSLILTKCESVKTVVQNLSYLIKHQLDELTLTFDKHVFHQIFNAKDYPKMVSDIGNQLLYTLSEIRSLRNLLFSKLNDS
jgi:hypothetical protein